MSRSADFGNSYDTKMIQAMHRFLATISLGALLAAAAWVGTIVAGATKPTVYRQLDDDPTIPMGLDKPVLGFAINAHHIARLGLYLRSVDRIAETGANALIVVTPMFQEHVDSNEIRLLPDRCPTDEQLLAIFDRARKRGLATALLPIILIEDPEEKEWRGVIRPTDWDAWWAAYDVFLDHFIHLANAADVDLLIIGSELNSTELQTDRWQMNFDRVRRQFAGRIGYAANWDRYEKVPFWDLVDVMCVSSYFEIGRGTDHPTVEYMTASWNRERDKLLKHAERVDRPLLLTEVGYPSLPAAGEFPWNYVAKKGTRADHQAQADCFEALFATWNEVIADASSAAMGVFCYHWDPYHHGGPFDTGYGVAGKLSREVIGRSFQRIRRRRAELEAALEPAAATRPAGPKK